MDYGSTDMIASKRKETSWRMMWRRPRKQRVADSRLNEPTKASPQLKSDHRPAKELSKKRPRWEQVLEGMAYMHSTYVGPSVYADPLILSDGQCAWCQTLY
jgi:hypothetical protein